MLDKDLSLCYLYKLRYDLLENKPEWLFLLKNPLIMFLGDIQGTTGFSDATVTIRTEGTPKLLQVLIFYFCL